MSSFMQREMELQIADEGLAGNEPASPDHNPKKHAEACHASSTPLSQASTAPTTPNMQFRLPSFSLDGFNDEHFPLLTRQLSIPEDEGATFEAPDMFQDISELYMQKYGKYSKEDSAYRDDDGAPGGANTRPRSSKESLQSLLAEVKDLYEQKYGTTFDQSQASEEEDAESDGPVWRVINGTGAPMDCRVARLEQELAEAKKLYELKYGVEIDAEDANVEYDADGTPWVETRGTGSPRDMRLERLEHMLGNVKGLFAQKYGRDVDTEYDADGTPWTVTEGTGVPRDCRVERLEQKLAEVKRLFVARYGTSFLTGDNDDWDEAIDFMYDEDGTLWIKSTTTGGPLRIASPLDETLEGMLQEVKTLCDKRFGHKPVEDIQSSWSDEDGAPWIQVGSSSSGASTEKAQPFTGTCGLQ